MPQATTDILAVEQGLDALMRAADEAGALFASGKQSDALSTVSRAVPFLGQELPRSGPAATALNTLGVLSFLSGYSRQAKSFYDRAFEIVETLDQKDPILVGNLLNNLGQVEARLGELDSARRYLERAVELGGEHLPNSVEFALVQDNLGGVYRELGRLEDAERLHRSALEIFQREKGFFHRDVATTLGNLSGVFKARGDRSRALAFRLRSLDINLRTGGSTSSGALLDLNDAVRLLLDVGKPKAADDLLNVMLKAAGSAPQATHRNLAERLLNLALATFANHRLDVAERCAVRALQFLEALEGEEAPETLRTVHLLGNIQRATADLDAAERSFKRALAGYQKTGAIGSAAAVMLDMGKVYTQRGAYELAAKLLGSALAHFRAQSGDNSPDTVSALGNYATLYYEWGKYPKAREFFELALKAVPPDRQSDRAWLVHGMAMLNYHLGDYDVASRHYSEALDIYIGLHSQDHAFVATTAENLALCLWAKGDMEGALRSFRHAASVREEQIRRTLALGTETKRIRLAKTLLADLFRVVSFHFASRRPNEDVARLAADLTLQRKGRVLDAMAHTLASARESGGPEVAQLIDRLQDVRCQIARGVLKLGSRREQPDDPRVGRLRGEEAALEEELSYRGALRDPDLETVTLDDVQKCLPADAALIEYLLLDVFDPQRHGDHRKERRNHYVAMVVRPTGGPRWFDLGPAEIIDDQVAKLRGALKNPGSSRREFLRAKARVYRSIVEPLKKALTRARHLIIAPDGSLALMPFEVLAQRGGAIGEQTLLSYVATGRHLLGIHGRPEQPTGEVVVVAAPDFNALESEPGAETEETSDETPFIPLPGTLAEAEDLAGLLEGVTPLTGTSATKSALMALRHPAVLHIATHGVFTPARDDRYTPVSDFFTIDGEFLWQQGTRREEPHAMFRSGIALAGANHWPNVATSGILTAQEIAGMDLRGTDLVVLSACETGMGTTRRGEEFAGLRRAVSIAGAAAQLTSLWRVHDAPTRAFMHQYYTFLVQGKGRAHALRLTQARFRRHKRQDWRHPFYWGAFILSGAWSPISQHLRRKRSRSSTARAHD
jgi:CHAT domain-containing protein/tetratricopeptide (TPR) repeat protein